MNVHGYVTIEWIENIVIINANGPFNELGINKSIEEIKCSILDKGIKQWCKLEVWDEETLGSPVVISLANEAYQWYQNNGCSYSAVVIRNNIQNDIVDKITNNNTKIFADKGQAIHWLKAQKA